MKVELDNVVVVKAFFEAMQADGPDKAAAAFGTADLVWWAPGVGEMQDNLVGLSKLIATHFDANGIELTIDGVTADGDRVAVEARSSGKLNSGAVYANTYHWLFVLREGKIAVIKEYNDTLHLNSVLGPILASAA